MSSSLTAKADGTKRKGWVVVGVIAIIATVVVFGLRLPAAWFDSSK